MCQQEACMDLLLGKMRFVQRKEVANVVGDQRPTELCRRHEHGSVSGAEELVMLGLDRLDIPPGPTSFRAGAPAGAAATAGGRGRRPHG
jgi:hypothetical protein